MLEHNDFFVLEQCNEIIKCGRQRKRRIGLHCCDEPERVPSLQIGYNASAK